MQTMVKCSRCNGTGNVPCTHCNGMGMSGDGARCKCCHGSGKVDCEQCEGSGSIPEEEAKMIAPKSRIVKIPDTGLMKAPEGKTQQGKTRSQESRKSQSKSEKKVQEPTKKAQEDAGLKDNMAGISTKRRWLFVVLGLIFGWFGAHYLYAGRWLLAAMTIVGLPVGIIMLCAGIDALGILLIVVWLVLWFGGVLFVSKDGKGNRM